MLWIDLGQRIESFVKGEQIGIRFKGNARNLGVGDGDGFGVDCSKRDLYSGEEMNASTAGLIHFEVPGMCVSAQSCVCRKTESAGIRQNRISTEQALTYRVFELFGDPRLPAEFAGAPGSGSNHLLLRELGTTIASLSSSAQAVLRPFLLPPIYAESWYAQRLGLPERAPAADALQAIATPTPSYNCEVSRLQAYYTRVSTTHFNIFYYKLGDAAYDGQSAAAVQLIATLVEQAYGADSDLLKRFIKLDDKEPCNGGDGAYDIYYGSFASKELGAWTSTYPLAPELIGQNACRNRPSMMMVNSQSAEFIAVNRNPQDAKLMVKSILAHELLHALQFAMDRPASCKDEEWIDEATAQWVMDHVVPTIPQGEPGEFGMESGLGRVSVNDRKSGPVLAEYLYSGHMTSIEKDGATPKIEKDGATPKLNGYSDYLFFQFLARKQTPDKIKQIFDAMVGGKNSVEAIAAVVDMKSVWPEFARSLWIGVDDKVLDYWATEDEYAFGLAKVYAEVPTTGIDPKLKDRLKSLKLDQKSQREAKFELLENALEFESGDYKIPPRSIFYEHLKFTDPTVHAVSFYNPIPELENKEFMKVQAVTKINGKWDPPEDWTTNTYKLFCLDKKNERIEELLIIVSNSEVNRSSEKPFTISASDPMLVETSNAGCWRWEGTASLTTNHVQGPVAVGSATVTFEPFRFQGQGTFPGFEAFKPTKLDASYTVNGPLLGTACTESGSDHVLLQDDDPSGFILLFNQPDPTASRLIFGGGSSTIVNFISTLTCSGQPPSTSKADKAFSWLSFPDDVQLSEDGRTISGRWDRTDSNGTKTSRWDFKALREQ